ncbi:cupin domain-containing protein [Paraburkholderia sp. CNPSo 3274]|uniref:cupin domain-containing protein n=1 Tax=Paraburkholderia sp. CNPSo 3274 TaxID=2940932 RepID=UPI0020B8FA3F|nr:cupin domain-containing protein [Paraburkholderia sp. CNPSo 3274]MCP3705963.1 cupin domain-containing protein [Paraburkholderia sp. CNPSo 3274]
MANDLPLAPGFSCIDSASMAWVPSRYAHGVEVKNLGKADGRAMQLVRFAAGATFPGHRHTGPEFIYVLEGEAVQNGRRLAAGYAGVAGRGTVDAEFHSDTGCVFLLVYDLDQVFDKT